ncbi:MAG TPA: hypothetical protein VF263_08895 [Longimicrobiaceae bacterium]
MTRYRAGYDSDHAGRGYDRGYRRLDTFGSGRGGRPWVGGYHEGYQGGSEGIAMNTTPTGYDRGYRGGPGQGGYDRGYRGGQEGRGRQAAGRAPIDRGDQGYMGGGGEYDPRYVRRRPEAYDHGYRGRGYGASDFERNRRY